MGRNRDGLINQMLEARAGSSNRDAYKGPTSRCVGSTNVYGHALIDATAVTQIVTLDNSIDWRDRIVILSAYTDNIPATGVPPVGPWICMPRSPANSSYILHGHIWLSAGGWDGLAAAGGAGAFSFAWMVHQIDRTTTSNVTFYADNISGALKCRPGQNRGITYSFQASEQLGFQVAID